MTPIPVEVRRRIIALYERGKETGAIADALGHCVAAVRRVRQHSASGARWTRPPTGAAGGSG